MSTRRKCQPNGFCHIMRPSSFTGAKYEKATDYANKCDGLGDTTRRRLRTVSHGPPATRGGQKKRVSYLHRTATTFYPCCGQALGEFKGSWSCRTYPWCKSSAFGRIYQISAHISSHFACTALALSGIGETPEGAARHLATALSRPGASVIRCGFYIFAIPKKQAF